jgi:hypothetical protein
MRRAPPSGPSVSPICARLYATRPMVYWKNVSSEPQPMDQEPIDRSFPALPDIGIAGSHPVRENQIEALVERYKRENPDLVEALRIFDVSQAAYALAVRSLLSVPLTTRASANATWSY